MPDSQAHSPAMGQEAGEKWTAAVDLQPATSKPDRLLARRIDALLPQTQCTRCGYPDCAAYADAIALEGAPINQCPPGGAEGVARLAALTGRPTLPLNPDHGSEGPRAVAFIDEDWCIGCTLCLDACPTDAIVGSNKRMHTVIEAHCTGCELCIPICPVDCILLENTSGDATGWAAWSTAQAASAQARYSTHRQRLRAAQTVRTPPPGTAPPAQIQAPVPADTPGSKQSTIAAALTRARQLRGAGDTSSR